MRLNRLYAIAFTISCSASVALGQGWRELTLPVNDTTLFLVDFVDSLNGWVGGSSGKLFHTSHGGNSWEALRVNTPLVLENMRFFDAQHGFVYGRSNLTSYFADTLLYLTSDCGLTWQRRSMPDSPAVRKVVFVDNSHGWILGDLVLRDYPNLWRTTDGAMTWDSLSIPSQSSQGQGSMILSVAFPTARKGFALDVDGLVIWPPPETRIRVTQDGGISWSLIEAIPETWCDEMTFEDSTHGFMTGAAGFDRPEFPDIYPFIRLTYDSGMSWVTLYGAFVKGIALDSVNIWLVEYSKGVLRTSDGGQTWKLFPFNESVLDFSYLNNTHIWLVTSRGRVYRYDVSITPVEPISDHLIPQVLRLYQNYPNPFNPSTTIEYEIGEEAHVNLKLFNVLGEELRTLVDQEQSAGRYRIAFEADGLASGIYFYQLRAGQIMQTRKAVLIR